MINKELLQETFKKYYNHKNDIEIILTLKGKKAATKDANGMIYEAYRKKYLESEGFTVIKFDDYPLDKFIFFNDKLVAFEEDKGSYLDSCFFDRALIGFAKQIKDLDSVPYLIISCPTTYSLYEEKIEEMFELLHPDLVNKMKGKIKYFPFCLHDRVNQKKFCITEDCGFILNDDLLNKEKEFLENLKK